MRMFSIIPFVLWLKWAAVICLIAGFYLYFRNIHTRQEKRIAQDRARHALASQLNAAYARTLHLFWVPLAMLFMAYIVYADMTLHQQKHRIHALSLALSESRDAHEQTIAELAALQSAPPELITEAMLDTLKERYEMLFINHYILRKCGLHGQTEYNRLNTIYEQETRSLPLPADFRRNIHIAAKGSFDELYDQVPCNSGHIRTLSTRMGEFLENRQ